MNVTSDRSTSDRATTDRATKDRAVSDRTTPAVHRFSRHESGRTAMRLLGYWQLHQTFGDRQELIDRQLVARTTCYRIEGEFREFFGVEVWDFKPTDRQLRKILEEVPVSVVRTKD